MFYAGIRQLISYCLLMIINVALLWTCNFPANNVLTYFCICCCISSVPAICASYFCLYVCYNFLDVFTSHSIHLVFLQDLSYHKDQNEVIKAENEDVSDVDYYKEEYPENIIDINDEEAHHLDLNIDEENYGQKKTNCRKKKNISLRAKRGDFFLICREITA